MGSIYFFFYTLMYRILEKHTLLNIIGPMSSYTWHRFPLYQKQYPALIDTIVYNVLYWFFPKLLPNYGCFWNVKNKRFSGKLICFRLSRFTVIIRISKGHIGVQRIVTKVSLQLPTLLSHKPAQELLYSVPTELCALLTLRSGEAGVPVYVGIWSRMAE